MTYAVFMDDDRISRPFETQGEAWTCAAEAGLVTEEDGVEILEGHCRIKQCEPELKMPDNLA